MENNLRTVSRNRLFSRGDPFPHEAFLGEGESSEARTRFRCNSPETISIDPTGFNTNQKGGNRLWTTELARFREVDFSKT